MPRVNVKDALLKYVTWRNSPVVRSSDLEDYFPKWFENMFGKKVLTGTIHRKWRLLKGDDGPLKVRTIRERPQGCWEILEINGIPWREVHNQSVRRIPHGRAS